MSNLIITLIIDLLKECAIDLIVELMKKFIGKKINKNRER